MASKMEDGIRHLVGKGLNGLATINRKRLKAPDGDHPYLTGIHKPLSTEITLDALRVTGTIPPALSGRYLRNGPNPALPPDPASYHWFVGAGMVHGIAISDGKAAWYHARWVKGREACAHLSIPLPPGHRADRNDAPDTHVIGIGARNFAIVEAGGMPVELTRELESIAHSDFDGTLHHAFSAHPHFCPTTRTYHAICYKGDVMDRVWHVVVDENARVIREEAIAVQHGPSIHDCAITRDHVLVFDLPVTFSMAKLVAGYPFPYAWNAQHKARVGVLRRDAPGAEIIWCDVDPCYVFHPANAFVDENGHIIVDVVTHDKMFARSNFGPDSEKSQFERWTIDMAAQNVARCTIDARPQEFPRYDERLTGQPYRYVITVAAMADAAVNLDLTETKLLRHDLHTGETLVHDFGPHRHPGEFVFVSSGDSADDLDGWYVGLVIDAARDASELAIISARDFTADPVATIHLPHRIPPGFHGNWVAD